MLDPWELSGALRAAVALREKLVVVRAGAGESEALAGDVALLRALGARPVVVCASAEASQSLAAALSRAGERPAALPGTSALRAGAPGALPTVDSLLLTQLGALGFVVVVSPPIAGAAGEGAGEAGTDLIASALAVSCGAERLVFAGAPPEGTVAPLLGAFGRSFSVAMGSLLLALLQDGTPAAPAAPGGAVA